MPAETSTPCDYPGAGRPAELLELGLASARPWRPEELAAAWEYHLSAPPRFDLSRLDAAEADEVRELLAEQGMLLASLRGLLRHPVPPVELLELTRDFATTSLQATDPPLPPDVANVLFHLAVAVALTRGGERISALSDAELLRGLDWSLAQVWVDESSRATLGRARRVVAATAGGA